MWPTLKGEVKASLPLSPSAALPLPASSAGFMRVAEHSLHMHPVQTIQQENIVAGLLAATPGMEVVVLMHGKVVSSNVVEITMRTEHVELSRALLTAATPYFA